MADTVPIPPAGWYDRTQENVYILLESPASTNKLRKAIIWFIAGLILLNVAVVVLETVNSIYFAYQTFFELFDLFTVIVFTTEYLLRVWCCVRSPEYASPVRGRLRYAISPFALLDLIALTPFYLPMVIPIEFRMLRLLRLLRLFRVIRLGRYSNAFETFLTVIRSKKEELVIAIVMALIILVLASSAMYTVEKDAQPEEFGSIPDAMWWAVITLATVGYGDVYPITPMGKFLASAVALSAIGLIALPTGILASGFAESLHKECSFEKGTGKALICPRCGAPIDPETGRELELPENGETVTGPADDGEILEELLR